MAAPSSAAALPVSVARNSRTGAAMLRTHAVRPVNGPACVVAITEPGERTWACVAIGRAYRRSRT
jgi:hypothetical protein